MPLAVELRIAGAGNRIANPVGLHVFEGAGCHQCACRLVFASSRTECDQEFIRGAHIGVDLKGKQVAESLIAQVLGLGLVETKGKGVAELHRAGT